MKIININDKVTIGKSKKAKEWTVLGLIYPLPHMGGGKYNIY